MILYDFLWLHNLAARTESMSQPVRCRCGGIYDLGTVTLVDRHFLDCSVWVTPCCRQRADDRHESAPGWTSVVWYERVPKNLRESLGFDAL